VPGILQSGALAGAGRRSPVSQWAFPGHHRSRYAVVVVMAYVRCVASWAWACWHVGKVFKVFKVFTQDVALGRARKQAVTPRCQGVGVFSGVFCFGGCWAVVRSRENGGDGWSRIAMESL